MLLSRCCSPFLKSACRGAPPVRHGLAVVLAWLASCPPLLAQVVSLPAIDAKWQHYTSPHFELYSHNRDRDSRNLLHSLEILRAVFLERLQLEERLRLDVTVYYFHTRESFLAYARGTPRENDSLAGFHLSLPDRAVISMAPPRDRADAQQTVFHEYVHHLFRITERDPPLWFNEGTADVLAGMRVERDHVLIGAPLDNRALYLRERALLPFEQLFAADHGSKLYTDEKHTGVFYAQSWALMHFWHFAETGAPKAAVHRFLSVAGDREKAGRADLRALFQNCFGCDYAEMQRRLERYIRKGTYRMGKHPLPKLPPASTYQVRPVPVEEITLRLAELAVRVNRSAVGRLALLDALTKRPNDPRPLETLGTEAHLQGDARAAAERWEQALAAGSRNPALVRELARMEGQQWFSHFDPDFRLPAEVTARMRQRLLHSIEVEPAQSFAYEMLSWVEALAETPDARNVSLFLAQLPKMPEKKRTLIGLCLLMLRAEKPTDAASILQHLATLQLTESESHATDLLRLKLRQDYPDVPLTEPGGAPAAVPLAPPPAEPGLKAPSVALPDDL